MPIGTVYNLKPLMKKPVAPRVEALQRALPEMQPSSDASSQSESYSQAPRALSTDASGASHWLPGGHAYSRTSTEDNQLSDYESDDPPSRGYRQSAPPQAPRTHSFDAAGHVPSPANGDDPVVRPYVPVHHHQLPSARVVARSSGRASSPIPQAPPPPPPVSNRAASPVQYGTSGPSNVSPAAEAAGLAVKMNGGVINSGPRTPRGESIIPARGSVAQAAMQRDKDELDQPAPAPAALSHSAPQPGRAQTMSTVPRSGTVMYGKETKKIMILYHSTYGHIKIMADAVAAGINTVEGAQAVLYQVPETLSEERLRKMNAPPRPSDPTLEYEEMNAILQDVAGIMLGIPTRFGMMPSQMKAWFDSTSKLWTKGHLVGKPAGCFFSTAVQGGGQETTALTTVTQLVHHGCVYVAPGFSFGGRMFDNSEVHGGSPYGAGCLAGGDGSRMPSRYELDFARHQGAQFAGIALKLARD